MRFRLKGGRSRETDVDITPMIDVVFLLIVFFLTTAQFAKMTRADVDLPLERGEGQIETDEPGIIVNVLVDGSIVVDDREIDDRRLREILDHEVTLQPGGDASRVKLLLRADRNLPAQRLNEIVRLIQDLGIGLGRFGTEIPR